tara:strand:- start:1468 stop:3135 length:1668 start_codon:yes stop_codon:yes gene_type:complete
MGAYENPITYIDKTSGQAWANAISGLGKTITYGLEKSAEKKNLKVARERKLIDNKLNYITKHNGEWAMAVSKSGVDDPSYFEAGTKLINDLANVQLEVKQARGKQEQQDALNKLAVLQSAMGDLRNIIGLTKSAKETYMKDIGLSGKNTANPGDEGGQSLLDKNYNNFMAITAGLPSVDGEEPGKQELFFNTETNRWMMNYTGGGFTGTPGGYTVDAIVAFNQDPGIIPNVTKDITDDLNTPVDETSSSGMAGLGIYAKDGSINPEYLKQESDQIDELQKDGTRKIFDIYPVDTEKVINAVMSRATAKANMYLKDPKAAQMVWQEVFGNEEALIMEGRSIAESDHEKFTKKMVEFYKSKIRNYEIKEKVVNVGQDGIQNTEIGEITDPRAKKYGLRYEKPKKPTPPADQSPIKAAETTQNIFTNAYDKKDFNFITDLGLKIQDQKITEISLDGNKIKMIYDVGVPKMVDGTMIQNTKELPLYNINNPEQMKQIARAYVNKQYSGLTKNNKSKIVRSMTDFFKEMAKNNKNTSAEKEPGKYNILNPIFDPKLKNNT